VSARAFLESLTQLEAVTEHLARAHSGLLMTASTDEGRREIVHLIGRSLAESCGADDGFALAAVLVEGMLERWEDVP
jgi:hypothetical protein